MRLVPIALMLLAACSPKTAPDAAPAETASTPNMANTAPPAAPSMPPGSAAAAYICPDKSEIFAMYVTDSTIHIYSGAAFRAWNDYTFALNPEKFCNFVIA